MHFKESKQMVYGMFCREGKGKGEMAQFYYKIKNNLKNVIHVCGGLGPVVCNLVSHQAPRIYLCQGYRHSWLSGPRYLNSCPRAFIVSSAVH